MAAFINIVVTFLGLHFRKKRFDFFKSLFVLKNKKIKILDIGGTQEFWKSMGFDCKNCSVTILNLSRIKVTLPNFKSVMGDARTMKLFDNKEFDVVFSNSVIEHLGD